MSDLTVYLAQVNQFWEDKQANIEHLNYLIEEANIIKRGLLVLPEMFNTGFTTQPERNADIWGESSSLDWLIDKSKSLEIGIITSLIIEEGGHYFNRLVFVSDGKLLGWYNKNYLFSLAGENKKFTPGNERHIFEFNGWKILPLICYDLRFPELSRIKMQEGIPEYEILVYVANWPEKRIEHWKKLLEARAIENLSYCIGVNRTGLDGNNNAYSGDSKVVNPVGESILEMEQQMEGISSVSLNFEFINTTRSMFGFLNDIK
ncbi:MAG: nitrilase-related carbon-nitrogen hydrolase [Crocinitomicaceae bacterium]